MSLCQRSLRFNTDSLACFWQLFGIHKRIFAGRNLIPSTVGKNLREKNIPSMIFLQNWYWHPLAILPPARFCVINWLSPRWKISLLII